MKIAAMVPRPSIFPPGPGDAMVGDGTTGAVVACAGTMVAVGVAAPTLPPTDMVCVHAFALLMPPLLSVTIADALYMPAVL